MTTANRLVLILVVAWAWSLPGTSFAFQRFDFDQRYLVQEGFTIKDHTLVQDDDGLYHIFYIKIDQSLPENETAKSLGHATSTDLAHWTFHPDVIHVVEDSWEELFIWAPHIVRRTFTPDGDSLYFMFYTGVNLNYAQATGLAYSTDLFNWTKWASNPVYIPDNSWANWNENSWSNSRDPFVFWDGGLWHLLTTASTLQLSGAISHAISSNLVDWIDQGPLFVHPGPNAWHVLESASLHFVNGAYHLFFTEEGVGGTSYMMSDNVLGPWDYAQVDSFDAGHASEFIRLDGRWHYSRHDAASYLGSPLYVIKVDFLNWETAAKPSIIQGDGPLSNWLHGGGTAFTLQPTFWDNTLAREADPSNFGGNSFLGTYEAFPGPLQSGAPGDTVGDEPTGIIRSPNFKLNGNRIAYRIGGGFDAQRLFIALRQSDGTELLRATGSGNGLETMSNRIWDVGEWTGQEVYLLIADLAPDGHLNVDEIIEYFDPNPATDSGALQPPTFVLHPNHPNPFNPETRITFYLGEAMQAALRIFDSRGRLVRTLWDAPLEAGRHVSVWDGRDDQGRRQSSGVYYYRLEGLKSPAQSRAMVLLK